VETLRSTFSESLTGTAVTLDKGQERGIELCAAGANLAAQRSDKSTEKGDHRPL
jgi:hypothetical protein